MGRGGGGGGGGLEFFFVCVRGAGGGGVEESLFKLLLQYENLFYGWWMQVGVSFTPI